MEYAKQSLKKQPLSEFFIAGQFMGFVPNHAQQVPVSVY